jgi:uncharacterized protein YneF (UPF0154 family)
MWYQSEQGRKVLLIVKIVAALVGFVIGTYIKYRIETGR